MDRLALLYSAYKLVICHITQPYNQSLKNIFYTLRKVISQIFGMTKPEILQEKSEYEIFWNKVDGSYEVAKNKKQIIDFYLGRNSYFHRNSDFGTHDTTVSFYSLKAYSKKYGNEQMLKSLKSDITNILGNDLTVLEFVMMLNYIWMYLVNFYENNSRKEFEIEWRVEKEIRILLKHHIEKFDNEFSNLLEVEYLSEEYFYVNLKKKLEIIKNRTGIDILEETGNNDIDYIDLKK